MTYTAAWVWGKRGKKKTRYSVFFSSDQHVGCELFSIITISSDLSLLSLLIAHLPPSPPNPSLRGSRVWDQGHLCSVFTLLIYSVMAYSLYVRVLLLSGYVRLLCIAIIWHVQVIWHVMGQFSQMFNRAGSCIWMNGVSVPGIKEPCNLSACLLSSLVLSATELLKQIGIFSNMSSYCWPSKKANKQLLYNVTLSCHVYFTVIMFYYILGEKPSLQSIFFSILFT